MEPFLPSWLWDWPHLHRRGTTPGGHETLLHLPHWWGEWTSRVAAVQLHHQMSVCYLVMCGRHFNGWRCMYMLNVCVGSYCIVRNYGAVLIWWFAIWQPPTIATWQSAYAIVIGHRQIKNSPVCSIHGFTNLMPAKYSRYKLPVFARWDCVCVCVCVCACIVCVCAYMCAVLGSEMFKCCTNNSLCVSDDGCLFCRRWEEMVSVLVWFTTTIPRRRRRSTPHHGPNSSRMSLTVKSSQ